jgi:uncharacterized Zn finger protein (UPF0148 family)
MPKRYRKAPGIEEANESLKSVAQRLEECLVAAMMLLYPGGGYTPEDAASMARVWNEDFLPALWRCREVGLEFNDSVQPIHADLYLGEMRTERDENKARALKAEKERDLAIAHDRQPYPTADAYEKVCAARTKWQERAEAAEQALAESRKAERQRVEAELREGLAEEVQEYQRVAEGAPGDFDQRERTKAWGAIEHIRRMIAALDSLEGSRDAAQKRHEDLGHSASESFTRCPDPGCQIEAANTPEDSDA